MRFQKPREIAFRVLQLREMRNEFTETLLQGAYYTTVATTLLWLLHYCCYYTTAATLVQGAEVKISSSILLYIGHAASSGILPYIEVMQPLFKYTTTYRQYSLFKSGSGGHRALGA